MYPQILLFEAQSLKEAISYIGNCPLHHFWETHRIHRTKNNYSSSPLDQGRIREVTGKSPFLALSDVCRQWSSKEHVSGADELSACSRVGMKILTKLAGSAGFASSEPSECEASEEFTHVQTEMV
jgi:hypothetical protein